MHKIVCAAAAALTLATPAMAQDCKPLRPLASIKMVQQPNDTRYLVPVTISDKEVYMLLDTGGWDMLYPEAVADLKLTTVRGNGGLIGVNGQRTDKMANLKNWKLGQITFTNSRYVFVDIDSNPDYPANHVAGLLGMQIINDVDIDLDFGNKLFNLFSPDHCDGKVVYWKADTVAIASFRFDDNGKVRVPVKLDGVDLVAMLDTGASGTALNQSIGTDRLNIDLAAPEVEKFGDENDPRYRKRFQTLELNGLTVSNPLVYIIPDKMKRYMNQGPNIGSSIRTNEDNRLPDLLLGANVLSKLHVYIATKEKKLYITPASVPAPTQ